MKVEVVSAKELDKEKWLQSARLKLIGSSFIDFEPAASLFSENFMAYILKFENSVKELILIYLDEVQEVGLLAGRMGLTPLGKALPLVKGDIVTEIYEEEDVIFLKITSMPENKIKYTRTIRIAKFDTASLVV